MNKYIRFVNQLTDYQLPEFMALVQHIQRVSVLIDVAVLLLGMAFGFWLGSNA